jgi:hypothetical protein
LNHVFNIDHGQVVLIVERDDQTERLRRVYISSQIIFNSTGEQFQRQSVIHSALVLFKQINGGATSIVARVYAIAASVRYIEIPEDKIRVTGLTVKNARYEKLCVVKTDRFFFLQVVGRTSDCVLQIGHMIRERSGLEQSFQVCYVLNS